MSYVNVIFVVTLGACADGSIRIWDPQDEKEICRSDPNDGHKKKINDMQLSKDRTMIITSSSDQTAKVTIYKIE